MNRIIECYLDAWRNWNNFSGRTRRSGYWYAFLANVIIVPWVLRFGYGMPDAIWYMMLTVGAGEVISVGILGTGLYEALRRRSGLLGLQ